VVLAAGESRRFPGNKLLFRVWGKSLIRRVVETALASLAGEVVVGVGHQADLISAELEGLDGRLRVVLNPDYREGMSSSVRVGVSAVSPRAEAVAVLPADVCFISPRAVDALILEYASSRPRIAVAAHGGRPGHPILFDASLLPELREVSEETMGMKAVVRRHSSEVVLVEVPEEEVLIDVDTLEDLRSYLQRRQPS